MFFTAEIPPADGIVTDIYPLCRLSEASDSQGCVLGWSGAGGVVVEVPQAGIVAVCAGGPSMKAVDGTVGSKFGGQCGGSEDI